MHFSSSTIALEQSALKPVIGVDEMFSLPFRDTSNDSRFLGSNHRE
jgi:hypothetical protein